MKKLLILSFLIMIILYSCTNTQSTQLSDEQKASIEQEVQDLYQDIVSKLSLLDMDVWSEPWSKDKLICINSGANYFDNFSEFKDSVTYWFSLRESQNVKLKQVNTKVFEENLVLMTSIANWNINFKDGNNMNVDALGTLLWKKEDSGWKIILLHESWQ